MKTSHRYRSDVTGRYVSTARAMRHSKTTALEKVQ